MSQDLLTRFEGVDGLARAELREVSGSVGIGFVRAAAVAAAFGLARRLSELRCRPGQPVRGGADVARVVLESSRTSSKESFFVLSLDARHRVMSLRVVSTGHLLGAPVHPREVFGPVLREGAAAVVVAHNHPSGDPEPSQADRLVTERLRQVGELVGIEVLDHVVVGRERYFSFADETYHAVE